jgi:hypothetical protein
MAELTEETGNALLEALGELRAELRRIRRGGLVARLSDAERDEIARQVYERIDERLAPAADRDLDDAPRGDRGFFKKR